LTYSHSSHLHIQQTLKLIQFSILIYLISGTPYPHQLLTRHFTSLCAKSSLKSLSFVAYFTLLYTYLLLYNQLYYIAWSFYGSIMTLSSPNFDSLFIECILFSYMSPTLFVHFCSYFYHTNSHTFIFWSFNPTFNNEFSWG
jgi:hypothetical protein